MKILLTNDDGIYAEGLRALYKRFAKKHDVTVVAPDRERSAASHAITLLEPLRATRIDANGGVSGYAVNGTPVDCVKMGVTEILASKPDIVISGINLGANVGVNINYSGTVAAAREAALYGVPAIAVSLPGSASTYYDEAALFTEMLTEKVYQKGLPFGTILNVNLPDGSLEEIKGVRISRQGLTCLSENFEKRTDPRDRTYYWYGSCSQSNFNNPDIDEAALCQNFISITPIQCDMTAYSIIEEIKGWKIKKMD